MSKVDYRNIEKVQGRCGGRAVVTGTRIRVSVILACYRGGMTVEEIVELNETYRVEDFAPGLVLFGSDGGDTGYAFDRRAEPVRIVSVPLVGMTLSEAEECGSNFTEFLRHIARPQSTQ